MKKFHRALVISAGRLLSRQINHSDKHMKAVFLLASLFLFATNAPAAFYTVTGTADNTDSVTHGGSGTAGSPFQMSSLRGATIAANSNPGSTIILPAGTYSLTIAGDANDRQFVS